MAPTIENAPPTPCKNLPILAMPLLPEANDNAPTAIATAATGRTFLGPKRSRDAPATRLKAEYP